MSHCCNPPCYDEPLTFGCAWCDKSNEPPTCLFYNRKGKCVRFSGDFVPNPSSCNDGAPAHAVIAFGNYTSVNHDGEGSFVWFGLQFWANYDSNTTAPTPGDVEVDIPALATATQIRDLYKAAFEGAGCTVQIINSTTIKVTWGSSGFLDEIGSSGMVSTSDVFSGEEPKTGDFCHVPRVTALPYDGLPGDTVTFPIDEDGDGIDDFTACMDACAASYDTDYASCPAGPGASHCSCNRSASQARQGCEWDCRISMVPKWLGVIQEDYIFRREECCGGEYSACAAAAEQAYLGTVASFESSDFAALKADFVAFYDDFGNNPQCPGEWCGGDYPCGDVEGYIEVTPWAAKLIIDRHSSDRWGHVAAAEKDRAYALAKCQGIEMNRRKRCAAREHECQGKCQADYDYAASQCYSTYAAGYLDSVLAGTPLSYTSVVACQEEVFATMATCKEECCKTEYPYVRNGHLRDDCFLEQFLATIGPRFDCCNEGVDCLNGCPPLDNACLDACVAAVNECNAATSDPDIENCIATHLGDCPNCFQQGAHIVPPEGPPRCTVSHPQVAECNPPDEHGNCRDTGMPCPDPPNPPCIDGTNCCLSFVDSPDTTLVSCPWFIGCWQGIEPDPPDPLYPIPCPDPFPHGPPVPPCELVVTGGSSGAGYPP